MEKQREQINEELLGRIKNFYRTSFKEKVSSKSAMDDFYLEAIKMSGIEYKINSSSKPLTIVDAAGGGGRIGELLKKQVRKDFNYVVVDINRAELVKGNGKLNVIGDMMNIPLADMKADAVFILDMPNSADFIADCVDKLKPKSKAEAEENRMLSFNLRAMSGNLDFLNYVEAIRVLKKDGIFVCGLAIHGDPTRGGLEGMFRENLLLFEGRGADLGGVPLRKKESEIMLLDKGVKNLWMNYGMDINKPLFYVESLRRTDYGIDVWSTALRKNLDFFLKELSKHERFLDIMDEVEKIRVKKSGEN